MTGLLRFAGEHKSFENTVENTIDIRKSKTAIAPNFIHSMDSAHLQTVIQMINKRPAVKDFMLIHDSFATTPAQTESSITGSVRLLSTCMRTGNIMPSCETRMNRLQEEWVPTEDIPALPSTGTMDVTVVLESKYCFS